MAFRIKKIKPLFTMVVTTAVRYKGDEGAEVGGLIVDTTKMNGSMNTIQTVVAVGSTVQGIKEGDVVKINFSRYTKARHIPGKMEDNIQSDNLSAYVELPYVEIDGKQYLKLQNNDIEFVIDEYDVDEGGLFQ